MAWIQQDPSGNFHISFRFGGRKFKRSLKTSVAKQAQLKKLRLEETIALLEAGRIKPPSPFTICHAGGFRCRIESGDSIEASHADKYFSNALAKSKFQHLRAWHVFRHSFCSNCAAKGIDQRFIDTWVGHQTDDQRRRYRHLYGVCHVDLETLTLSVHFLSGPFF